MLHLHHRLNLILENSSELDFLHGFLCEVLPVSTDLRAASQSVFI